jgi:hypothetical protein
MGHVT